MPDLRTDPDDARFAAWCEVWAASQRGHRLGARVETAVLREPAATVPEVRWISTYDAESNRPMVAVNEAPGFRRAGGLSASTRRL